MKFSKYISTCRGNLQYTQEELVQKLYYFDDTFKGLDINTLSRWERGLTKPSYERQVKMIEFFSQETNMVFPYFEELCTNIEDEVCSTAVSNLIGNNKQLIMNFPSDSMELEEIKITHLRNSLQIDQTIGLSQSILQGLVKVPLPFNEEDIKRVAIHPSNFLLVAQFQNQFFGMLFVLRVKPNILEDLLSSRKEWYKLEDEDFASFDEVGSNFIFNFYAYNSKVASLLFVRFFAYLIANRNSIKDIGSHTVHDQGKKLLRNLNMKLVGEFDFPQIKLASHKASICEVLVNEDILKMIF